MLEARDLPHSHLSGHLQAHLEKVVEVRTAVAVGVHVLRRSILRGSYHVQRFVPVPTHGQPRSHSTLSCLPARAEANNVASAAQDDRQARGRLSGKGPDGVPQIGRLTVRPHARSSSRLLLLLSKAPRNLHAFTLFRAKAFAALLPTLPCA